MINLSKQEYNFVKFDIFDENEFYVSSKQSFKVFDTRTFKEIYEIPQFKNCLDIYNDNSSNYLISKKDSLTHICYETNMKKYTEIKNWEINDISCLSINNPLLKNPEIIAIGCENGDIYYSNIIE